MIKLLFLYSFISFAYSFTSDLCVVGATSGLGRELIYQTINIRKKSVLALTCSTNNKIYLPYRGDSFNYKETNETFAKNIDIDTYWVAKPYQYKHVVFCTSAKPFEKDYSDTVTKKIIDNIPECCQSISLVSAYGVGDSLENANLGIQIMNSLYLRDVYRAKNKQEELINFYNNPNICKNIYRPKALSYGQTVLESMSRADFAERILDDIRL